MLLIWRKPAKQLDTVRDMWVFTDIAVDVSAQIVNVLRRYDVVRAYGQWAAGNELLLTSRSAAQCLGFVGV